MSANDTSFDIRPWLTVICGISFSAGFAGEWTGVISENVSRLLYMLAYLTGGYAGVKEMIRDLRNREINIDFLMIAAATGAAIIDQWLEGAILLFLFSLSENLENYAMGKSRSAIHSLMQLRPSRALLVHRDGREEEVPTESLLPGQIVIVRPGEYIPIDGVVTEGETSIDQSAITGESRPVIKENGDPVFAATLNREGVIRLEVTRQAGETLLAGIVRMVEEAQGKKASAQRLLERFEPAYAVGVLLFTTVLILIPWLFLEQAFEPVFYRAMTVLVVASPCALIISTPAAIISAIANGARNGILFKGGVHIEQTSRIDTIAFDKTGTLTVGQPVVTDLLPLEPEDGGAGNRILALAAGCEQHSEHHLAEAILNRAAEESIAPAVVSNVKTTPGKGISGRWEQQRVSVGNRAFFQKKIDQWPEKALQQAGQLEREGKTVVFVTLDETLLGIIAFKDRLREGAAGTIRELRAAGVKKIVMLTGDNPGVAARIATELDLDEIHAGLLPAEKVRKIQELSESGNVAMVGDGINDAPALAASQLGIAMGAAGTDVALETADVVLMGDDLTRLPYLLKLAGKSKRIVWQNIIFSLLVILLLLAGVFLIDLPLTAGVIGHEGSTLIVVLNGLRLLHGGRTDSDPPDASL